MKVKITKDIGKVKYSFEIDKEKGLDALSEAGFLSAMPTKCKICESENIHLATNKAKGYVFVKMLCEDCNARSPIGQYKEGGFFWKEWEKYTPPAATGEGEPSQEEPPQEE